jgi:homoserine O-acetyltransferase
MLIRRPIPLLIVLSVVHLAAQQPPAPLVASLGTCVLASGAAIDNCRMAYRTFGHLDSAGTNAVLVPPWMLGRSENSAVLLGVGGLVDTTRYFAILVDALGNGVSSSPSNTTGASRAAFADLTIGDMVTAQYRLVRERLHLKRLHAVVGISMGGMQAFEWAVRYPDFVDVVIPISGTPRVTSYDRLLWTTLLSEIESGRVRGAGGDSVWTQLWRLTTLVGSTPRDVNQSSAAEVDHNVAESTDAFRQSWSLDDYAVEMRAARRHDVAAVYGGDVAAAAKRVRARMLIVYSWDDHTVTPLSSAEFAKLVHADTLSVASACGHGAAACESGRVNPAVRAFLGP